MDRAHVSSLRRNDVDWFRVTATYLLFAFHTAVIFSPAPFFHVRNGELARRTRRGRISGRSM